VFSELFHDARCFVTKKHRHRAWPAAVHDGEVGVANARHFNSHEQFSAAGFFEFKFGYRDGLR
jgi:hypothetical protein